MYHDKCRIQISGFGEDTAGEWKRKRLVMALIGLPIYLDREEWGGSCGSVPS
jgi:hypothetical protein